MRGNARITISDRVSDVEEMRKEILGAAPKGPYEFSKDLTFDDYKPTEKEAEVLRRFKHAVRRDARFGSASACYIRLHGMSQSIRSTYDGGRQLVDGGMK